MISMVRGNIEEIGINYAIIDVNGVGYKVYVTADSLHGMKLGTEIRLSTYLVVREDALDLYGFTNKKEKDLFILLISVSGIGPKSALNILTLVSADTLVGAIRTGSTAHLVKVSGLGRKTAEKIVLELKDKLGGIGPSDDPLSVAGMSSDLDAIAALQALGYEADESREALKKIDPEIADTSKKVKAALKMLGK